MTMKSALAGAAVCLTFYLSLGRLLLAGTHLCDTLSTLTDPTPLSCRANPQTFATLCELQVMPTLLAPSRWPSPHTRWLPLLTLLLCGDVEYNPGPSQPKYPCGTCQRAVRSNQPGVQCEVCYLWYHTKCLGLTSMDYSKLQQPDDPCMVLSFLFQTRPPFPRLLLNYKQLKFPKPTYPISQPPSMPSSTSEWTFKESHHSLY